MVMHDVVDVSVLGLITNLTILITPIRSTD